MAKGLSLLLLSASLAWAQPPAPAWKEFSIGPPTRNQTGFGPQGMRAAGGPLIRAISKAYGLPEHRILGPAWVASERYAITALVSSPQDFQPLFQQELTARLHMVAHRETKEVPVYLLQSAPVPRQQEAALSRRGQKAGRRHDDPCFQHDGFCLRGYSRRRH